MGMVNFMLISLAVAEASCLWALYFSGH